MGIFHKKSSRAEEAAEQDYKECTRQILSYIKCPHRVFAEGGSPETVNKAYRDALVRGRTEGFIPVLVLADETLAEWLGILEDEAYSREEILQQDKKDAGALLEKWYEDNMEIYDESFGDREEWERERDREFLGEMQAGEEIDCLTSFESFSGKGIEETILFEIPVKNPWEVIAWVPMGGWNECPAPSEMMEVCRRWYEKYGAVPAAFSHDTLEFVLDKPVGDEEKAWETAREHYAFCPDRVDQGTETGTLGEVADSIRRSKVWYFWWD